MTVIRIERIKPRPGGSEEADLTARGYELAERKHGDEKHHVANAIFVSTLDEAADLVERGYSIRMSRKGMRASMICPRSVRIVRI